jgi:hypothetical protein
MSLTKLDTKMVETPTEFNTVTITNLNSTSIANGGTINTSNIVTTNRVTTNELVTNSLTATNVNYFVKVTTSNVTFTSNDNSKAYHFNTNSPNTNLIAYFPNSLPNGFNVSVFNIGTGTITLSSDQTAPNYINATGQLNETQYTGFFIYKANNELYGVGVFE